ncbi:efflux RND transporter permease subunit [Litorilituus lipolyticus]|uniref:Efflux RND transporter permease subunit n=1 Tax=Litorilituus lipolyticus TaxID=2491017 RepID=A0A502KVH0_9GAMM|nr:efflux RND transporter permease subunit [Litorilituus lipolyticus]TPH15104.1 efflux RND transporter permease subunit [Litorilituus lipolyticus]
MSKSRLNLTALAIRKPVTTMMLCLTMLLMGVAASQLLPLEKWPGIDIPEMMISAPYQASTPAEVERLVTKPLEEALATMGGIQRLNSRSTEHGSEIGIEVEWESSLTGKAIEAREKIDAVRHLLPEDLQRVFVYQFSTADMPILTLRISSERELKNSFQLLNNYLKKPLERLTGVSKVELYGVDQRQISIRLLSDRMASHGVDVRQLTQTLQAHNFTINAGSLKSATNTIRISPKGEFTNLNDINALMVKDNVYLGDVASVQFEQPERQDGRHLDRSYAIGVNVFKESSANLVEVAGRVVKLVDEISQSPQFSGINIFMMEDQAKGVTDSLSDLLMAGAIGAALSFIVLYLFVRNTTATLLVVASVPFSICITLAVMFFLDYSLNILSMMGLLLAVGMLVDNSVVITESIAAQHKATPAKDKAGKISNILLGVDKVSLAVMTGTLTTMIVFMPNIIGEKVQLTVFLEHVAIAICISLAASLLIAKTLLPLLLSKISLDNIGAKQVDNKPSKASQKYKRSLTWVLAHPKITGFVALLILASTAIPMGVITSDNNDNQDGTRLFMRYHVEGQFPLEHVEAMVDRMEEYLYANQEEFYIESVYSYYNGERASSTLLLKEDRDISMNTLKERIRKNMPVFAEAKPDFGWQSAKSGGVSLTLLGPSTEMLMTLSEQIVPVLSHVEGLADVKSDISQHQKEMVIVIDRFKANQLGLDSSQVAQIVGTALRGLQLRSFRHDPNGEVNIRLLYDERLKYSLNQLKKLPITQIDGQDISLESVANFKAQPRLATIYREERHTALTIGANLNEITMEQAKERIEQAMATLNLPSGYSWKLGRGFNRQQQEQNIMMVNMLLALAMIYIVMAALFESLLLPAAIISSIIYSIVGVFWFFLITGTNMSVMGMIGILILMGIVVNNGIVLIDQINQMSPKLEQLESVIADICVTRLRPVLMTVATTVLGMVPLALGSTQIGGDGPSYSPLAIAIIGGLTFSTITSLFLVPWCYLMFTRLANRSSIGFAKANGFAKRIAKV